MKKIFILLGLILLVVVGCGSTGIKNVNFKTFNKMIDNKESFIIYIGSSECSACKIFEPTFKSVLTEYDVTSYHINLTSLTDEEKKELSSIVAYTSTPTVAFIKEGVDAGILTHINDGSISKNAIISRLTSFGYISDKVINTNE